MYACIINEKKFNYVFFCDYGSQKVVSEMYCMVWRV